MTDQVVIESRFRGPPDSANGGYACGVLARLIEPRAAEVTLRLPPPLDRPLEMETSDGETAFMRDGDAVIAEAHAIDELELEIPSPVDVEEAASARDASPMQQEHPFPHCFVCGPKRLRGDGLGVTCGPTHAGLVASPWQVDDSVPSRDAEVNPEIVWAVLDCPGGIAGMLLPDLGVCVLGRLAAQITGRIAPGMTCIAIGWPIGRDGRKVAAGSAVFSEEGELLARARATWIELKR
ncbi:MAG TPA: hypothetical protein VN756_13040 [Solirubrobacterales bacterium]|nr:hypothetical protein [Solirubrobacterales bacterium]